MNAASFPNPSLTAHTIIALNCIVTRVSLRGTYSMILSTSKVMTGSIRSLVIFYNPLPRREQCTGIVVKLRLGVRD